mmetsp:Transcript_1953/g.4314  ORF Transcript_1953/g.4314 Transcript_1953/m.4314 type:complete len:217 (+) Transcript_1953:456-1106(+)
MLGAHDSFGSLHERLVRVWDALVRHGSLHGYQRDLNDLYSGLPGPGRPAASTPEGAHRGHCLRCCCRGKACLFSRRVSGHVTQQGGLQDHAECGWEQRHSQHGAEVEGLPLRNVCVAFGQRGGLHVQPAADCEGLLGRAGRPFRPLCSKRSTLDAGTTELGAVRVEPEGSAGVLGFCLCSLVPLLRLGRRRGSVADRRCARLPDVVECHGQCDRRS